MSIKTSQAILKWSIDLKWLVYTGLRSMTKPCFVTMGFFDFVKFIENIELPAIYCFENLDRHMYSWHSLGTVVVWL